MQTQMETIALFPLNSVMFPKGRVSLQIFESRYVDMIRQCLRETSGFGVVLIATGSEVARSGEKLDVHRVGTYCEIVDWNQLPNGLLGITAEAAVPVMKVLGFKVSITAAGLAFAVRRRTPPHIKALRLKERPQDNEALSDSPFAKLKELMPS